MWTKLTPYCHCKEALKSSSYMLGILAPFVVLGIGIFILSLFTGSLSAFFLSAINIVYTCGDLTIAFLLLKHKKSLIYDHPTECGFLAFYK